MNTNVKNFNKALAQGIKQCIKKLCTKTKWGASQRCKAGSEFKNQRNSQSLQTNVAKSHDNIN